MSGLPVEITGAARLDLLASRAWYEAQRPGLGLRFSARIAEAIERISHQPTGGPEIHRGVRRVVTRQFHHLLFYRIEPHRVVILGVRHVRQDPATWPKP